MNAFAIAVILTIVIKCGDIPYVGPVIQFVFFGGILSLFTAVIYTAFIK